MRRMIVAIVLLAPLMSATPVLAVPGCGAAYDLFSVAETTNRVDQRIYDEAEWADIVALIASVDANGDHFLCSKQSKPNQGRDKQWIGPEDTGVSDYVVTQIMDNKSMGHSE